MCAPLTFDLTRASFVSRQSPASTPRVNAKPFGCSAALTHSAPAYEQPGQERRPRPLTTTASQRATHQPSRPPRPDAQEKLDRVRKGLDRRQRGQAPPGRREPKQPIAGRSQMAELYLSSLGGIIRACAVDGPFLCAVSPQGVRSVDLT
jgi:hypothetical protein